MNLSFLNRFIEDVGNDNFSILCRSDFNEKMAGALLGLSEQYLNDWEAPVGWHKRNVLLMVEAVQNIHRHAPIEGDCWKDNHFFLSGNASHFDFYSANCVEDHEVSMLRERLEKLHSYSEEELKQAYHHQIKYGEESKKGGAGLGLMYMKRKSTEMATRLTESDDHNRMLEVKLWNAPNTLEDRTDTANESLLKSSEVREAITDEGILMLYHGKFTDELVSYLLEICRYNPSIGNSKAQQHHVAHVLVELIQNIRKHSSEDAKSLVCISHNKDAYQITTLNEVSEQHREVLKQNVEDCTAMDELQIHDRYLEAITSNNTQTRMGLLDISRITGGNIDLAFFRNEESAIFAGIQTEISPP